MTPNRILFVDALRGVAAVAVVLYHYGERIGWNNWGNMGVPMFFVLSGFVIAMSVGQKPPVSVGFLGRFALRRALRLDPPYWASIAAVIFIGLGAAAVLGTQPHPTTFSQVLSHMFYLQGFMGHEPILVVYWTLCYEIQFYLVLIPLLWAGHRIRAVMPLMFATMVLSMIDRRFELTNVAFMGRFWFCFASGAMVYWATTGRLKSGYLLTVLAIVGTFGAMTLDPYAATVTITATALYAVIGLGHARLGSSRPLQFLGQISYSLYLTHLIGGWLVLTLALRFLPAWLALVLAVASSIISAWVFYLVVEAPAARFSKRVKLEVTRPNASPDFLLDLERQRSNEPCPKCNDTGELLLDNVAVGGTESDLRGPCTCKWASPVERVAGHSLGESALIPSGRRSRFAGHLHWTAPVTSMPLRFLPGGSRENPYD